MRYEFLVLTVVTTNGYSGGNIMASQVSQSQGDVTDFFSRLSITQARAWLAARGQQSKRRQVKNDVQSLRRPKKSVFAFPMIL